MALLSLGTLFFHSRSLSYNYTKLLSRTLEPIFKKLPPGKDVITWFTNEKWLVCHLIYPPCINQSNGSFIVSHPCRAMCLMGYNSFSSSGSVLRLVVDNWVVLSTYCPRIFDDDGELLKMSNCSDFCEADQARPEYCQMRGNGRYGWLFHLYLILTHDPRVNALLCFFRSSQLGPYKMLLYSTVLFFLKTDRHSG